MKKAKIYSVLLSLISVFVIVFSSCDSSEANKNKSDSESESEKVHDAIADSLMFDPYFNKVFVEGPMYYKSSFNEKYIRGRKIESIKMIMFEEKNGSWVDYDETRIYNFSEDGKLQSYFTYDHDEGVNDTSFYNYFTYEDGHVSYQEIGYLSPPNGNSYFEYYYEGEVISMAEYMDNALNKLTHFVYEGDPLTNGKLTRMEDHMKDTLRMLYLFNEGKITDKIMKDAASENKQYLNSDGFWWMYITETKNGTPVYRIRVNPDGTQFKDDEDWWAYNEDGKLIAHSFKTIEGKTLSDRFEYGNDGLIKTVYWTDDYKFEVSYTFRK